MRGPGLAKRLSVVAVALAIGVAACMPGTRSEPPGSKVDLSSTTVDSVIRVETPSPPATTVPPPSPSPLPTTITVYVNGAVTHPGVYTLPEGSRVVQALTAAGGLTGAADADGLNQARPLHDGEQVYVPARGTPPPPLVGPAGAASPAGKATAATGGVVNLNTATKEELDALPGVGAVLADRIIQYRQKNGPFQRPEDLKKVPGFGGTKLFDGLKDRITAP
ncbi:MAG: ComEA family DNA-binding protein [Anaerolineae bacterium]